MSAQTFVSTVLAVVVAAGSVASVQAEPPPAPAQPDEPIDIAAWAKQIRPDIEAITGKTFAAEVPVKSVNADDLASLIGKTIQADMVGAKRPDGKPMTEMEITARSMSAAYKVAGRTFGLYRYEDKTVYVVPSNAEKYARKHGWSAQTASRVPRLALAHEMVHALQDQRVSLGARSAKVEGEERAALVCVSEGHAVWATDALAKKLGWETANGVLWGTVTGVQTDDEPRPGGGKGPVQPASPALRVAPAAETYTAGKKFVEHHAAFAGEGGGGLKGNDRLWAILASPPKTMDEIREPAKFEVKATGPDTTAPAKP